MQKTTKYNAQDSVRYNLYVIILTDLLIYEGQFSRSRYKTYPTAPLRYHHTLLSMAKQTENRSLRLLRASCYDPGVLQLLNLRTAENAKTSLCDAEKMDGRVSIREHRDQRPI